MSKQTLTIFLLEMTPSLIAFALVLFFLLAIRILTQDSAKKGVDQYLLALKESENRLKIAEAESEAKEDYLTNVSDELSQNIAQYLCLAKMRLTANSATHDTEAQETSGILGKVINDIRDLTRPIDAGRIREAGFQYILVDELHAIKTKHSIYSDVTEDRGLVDIGPECSVLLYRITHEAIQNVVKRAKATAIRIFMSKEDDIVSIAVIDNGIGFPKQVREGRGFRNMRARAAALNGEIKFDSTKKGTTVLIEIPEKNAEN